MPLWFAGFLGLVQGLTEFIPVSSTAHLRLAPTLVGQPDAGAAYTAVIQLGTLAAVIGYFLREIGVMTKALVKDPTSQPAREAYYIVAGTVPIGVLGMLFKKHITGELRSLWVIAGALIVVGVIMALVDRGRGSRGRTMEEMTLRDALLIGLGQACALIPGVSRSGATIITALLVGLARPDAARFSFLLSIPAVAAAGIFELRDAAHELGSAGLAPLLVGTVVAFVTGYASIAWLLRFLRTRSLAGFAVYRVLLGAALIVLCVTGVIRD
jgi:undecaprenyl-diphosphatase